MHQRTSSMSYPAQFALLLGLMGACLIIGSLLVVFLGTQLLGQPLMAIPNALNRPENAQMARLLNTLATAISFLLPTLIWARIVQKKPWQQIGFNGLLSIKQMVLVVIITATAVIVSGALGTLNQHVPLSDAWMKKAMALEQAYKDTMLNMARMHSFSEYLVALAVMALAPAIFEEVLFRGGFQQILIGWTKNAFAGILIASIFFSIIHFSFFGFLPRLALGAILGLIFYYSKNIWLNILMHFLNNALVVTQMYILTQRGDNLEKTMEESVPVWWGVIGILALFFIFRAFRKASEEKLSLNTPSSLSA